MLANLCIYVITTRICMKPRYYGKEIHTVFLLNEKYINNFEGCFLFAATCIHHETAKTNLSNLWRRIRRSNVEEL